MDSALSDLRNAIDRLRDVLTGVTRLRDEMEHFPYYVQRNDGLDDFFREEKGQVYQREYFAHEQRLVEFLSPQSCAWAHCNSRAYMGVLADLRRRRYLAPPADQPLTLIDGTVVSLPRSPLEWYSVAQPLISEPNRRPPQDSLQWMLVGPDRPRWTVLPLCFAHAHTAQLYFMPYGRYTAASRAVLTRSLLDELRADAERTAPYPTTHQFSSGTYTVLTDGGPRALDIRTSNNHYTPTNTTYPSLLRAQQTVCAWSSDQEMPPAARDIVRHALPYEFVRDETLFVCSIDACRDLVVAGRNGYYYCDDHATLHDGLSVGMSDAPDGAHHARVVQYVRDRQGIEKLVTGGHLR